MKTNILDDNTLVGIKFCREGERGVIPLPLLKGVGVGKKLTFFFKELTPCSRTYELRGQGKKKMV